jgi:hypothetical protein
VSGYPDLEALWLSRVRDVPGYDANNTSRGKFGILNNGKSDTYVIVMPGEHNREMISFKTQLNTWQTIIEVYQKYRDDGDTLTTLQTAVNTILSYLDPRRVLGDTGGTVRKGRVVSIRPIVRYPMDKPDWLIAALVGQVDEEETITFSE